MDIVLWVESGVVGIVVAAEMIGLAVVVRKELVGFRGLAVEEGIWSVGPTDPGVV